MLELLWIVPTMEKSLIDMVEIIWMSLFKDKVQVVAFL